MSFIVVTVSDRHCCNIDYHKSNKLDRNKQYISKKQSVIWNYILEAIRCSSAAFPFPDCFLFRTVRLQRPGFAFSKARPKMYSTFRVISLNLNILIMTKTSQLRLIFSKFIIHNIGIHIEFFFNSYIGAISFIY